MARNAAKSKALQPRGGIQTRLEKQKAKAKGIDPEAEIEETEDRAISTGGVELTNRSEVTEGGENCIPSEQADPLAQKHKGRGRPTNGVNRTSLTLRPNGETVKRLRTYATESGYGMSDIVDVLVELFLDNERVAKQLAKSKIRRKS